jgi:hypothetical protein
MISWKVCGRWWLKSVRRVSDFTREDRVKPLKSLPGYMASQPLEDSLRKRSSDVSTNETARKKARTDPRPSHAVSDSDSEEEIPMVRGRRTTRIADDHDDNNDVATDVLPESESEVRDDGNASPAQLGHGYRNVTNRNSVPPRSNLTLGQKSSGPQIPRYRVTPIKFFMVRKVVEETHNHPREQIAGKTLSEYSVWHN